MPIDDYTQREIDVRVAAALAQAGVRVVLPTPLETVAALAADIREIVSITDIPLAVRRRKPPSLKALLGAIGFGSRTVFLDREQPDVRERFTLAHEIGHGIVPWHEEIAYFDDAVHLFRDTHKSVEEEANAAAAGLIFQNDVFATRLRDYEQSLTTPLVLSDDFGASRHATIREFVRSHHRPCALVIGGRHVVTDGTVPIYTTVTSRAFRERFGTLESVLGADRLRVRADQGALRAVAHAVTAAKARTGVASAELEVFDLGGNEARLVVEAFDNGYNLFVMLSSRARIRIGRRVSVAV